MTSIVASMSTTDDVVNLSRESKNDENKLQKRMIISTLHHIFKTFENEEMYDCFIITLIQIIKPKFICRINIQQKDFDWFMTT